LKSDWKENLKHLKQEKLAGTVPTKKKIWRDLPKAQGASVDKEVG
jgi:hypothetical protein